MTQNLQNRLRTLYKKHRHFIVYSVIGGTGASLDFLSFLILYNVFNVPAVISTIFSISLGIINNFILNTVFNFKLYNHLWKRFVSFYLVGLFGLIVSIIIIALFNGVFGVDANIAKLISIPCIVVLQFFLNKRISFSDEIHFSTFFTKLKRHLLVLLVGFVFLATSLAFVTQIPYPDGPAAGPDERGHYGYNVKYLIEKHHLPVAGKDDTSAYQTCRNNEFGKVTCLYSYVAYPGFNYVVSAVFAVVAHDTIGVSYLTGGRLASTFWGLIFIAFLYMAVYRLTKNRKLSAGLTASAALIPQVVFVFSYINQDAHSLAISAIIAYALVRLLQDRSRSSTLIFAFSFGGLAPLAKYNYFLLIIAVLSVLIYALFSKLISFKLLLQTALYSLLFFVVIAAFWYIRNLALYHDPLGQSYMLDLMSKQPYQGQAQPINVDTLRSFIGFGFFDITFRSFWASFGYMAYYFKDGAYEVIRAGLVGLSVVYLYLALSSKAFRALLIYFGIMLLVIIGAIGLSLYNSAIYDFQPQGRYIFQIITPVIVLLALAYGLDRRMRFIALGLVCISAFCFYEAIDLFGRFYL